MPKFDDFKSMIEDQPPSASELKETVASYSEALILLYVRSRYDDFFKERYPTGSVLQSNRESWTFDFDTHMTKAQDEELRSMCWQSATNFIIDMLVRIDAVLDKDESALDALSNDLRGLGTSFESAPTDAKLGIVQTQFEGWRGEAGTAIRQNYSDHFTRSTQSHAEMANALANAAELDSLVMMKLRHHIDGLVQTAGAAIANGPSGDASGRIIGWLTLIGTAASAPGGLAAMSATAWVASTLKTGINELALKDAGDEPKLDSPDPDVLREQVLAAFDQIEGVVRQDRETLAGDLIAVFENYAEMAASGDPARSSLVVPNPNGIDSVKL